MWQFRKKNNWPFVYICFLLRVFEHVYNVPHKPDRRAKFNDYWVSFRSILCFIRLLCVYVTNKKLYISRKRFCARANELLSNDRVPVDRRITFRRNNKYKNDFNFIPDHTYICIELVLIILLQYYTTGKEKKSLMHRIFSFNGTVCCDTHVELWALHNFVFNLNAFSECGVLLLISLEK